MGVVSLHKLGLVYLENFEILTIENLVDTDWRKTIVSYLENPVGSTDRKVKYRSLSYMLIGNKLFKKTPERVLLKCFGESETYLAVLYRLGCQECKVHSSIQHVTASELYALVKPWPFREWALDLIGEIRPASSKGQKYNLVGIDYLTKRIETIPLVNVDQDTIIEFIQINIIYKFGLPEAITTYQGSVFTRRKMQESAYEMGIKLLTSTPYYAQENGQVKEANKIVISLIKKHVGKKPKNWHKMFDQVLWACQASPKEVTNTTPRLTYGHEFVFPIEIYLQLVRIQRQGEIPSDHYWSMMLDEMVDLDEEKLVALDMLIRQKE
ncbi:uncharacterized protein LOC127096054 [Lathyrus oleraceus]|uniref:uncharacterized protein LOC127096054 n=1 Tax=Pisum sativum TaxID=3888 RepID=UPI0021D2BB56|nr:uncharacterized protein LOC127096054 [Pisum sativum]